MILKVIKKSESLPSFVEVVRVEAGDDYIQVTQRGHSHSTSYVFDFNARLDLLSDDGTLLHQYL